MTGGLLAATCATLALMNLFATGGPITFMGFIGGTCAITTGVRLVRGNPALKTPYRRGTAAADLRGSRA